MTVITSVALFVLAAVAEIGGAYLVWQGVRRGQRGVVWIGAGVLARWGRPAPPRGDRAIHCGAGAAQTA